MAPSPTIPTSFVPKQPVRAPQRFSKSGSNLLLLVSLFLFGVAIVGSVGVFGYKQYLLSIRDGKQADVIKAQEEINTQAVEDFIRTRDRFSAAKDLLNAHVATTQFLDTLEAITLQNVRFDTLSFNLTEDRSAEIRMDGNARTFNALAAQSSLFAEERYIRRAIFSDINVNENNTVSFTLTADLEAELLTLRGAPPVQATPQDASVAPAPEEMPVEEESVAPTSL